MATNTTATRADDDPRTGGRRSRWRSAAARALLATAALGAATSFASAIGRTIDANAATQAVEAWRMVGFATFAALFALLAWRPRAYPGLFETVIVSKALLTILGVTLLTSAEGAQELAVFDGILTLVLLGAYALAGAWRAWGWVR